MRAILDAAPDAVISTDVRGVVTGWNARATGIFGWSAAEAIGRPLIELVVPPHLAAIARAALSERDPRPDGGDAHALRGAGRRSHGPGVPDRGLGRPAR